MAVAAKKIHRAQSRRVPKAESTLFSARFGMGRWGKSN